MNFDTDSTTIREVGVRELEDQIASVLARVLDGERVIVTRRGKPIAVLLGVEEAMELILLSSEEFVRMRLRTRDGR
jgi:prevent-host-death family protein